ncbi:MAG: radical SAM protein [Oscillospiraceae bacterium]|nr:radical SAM protein [Oscillospiraceae bacterium]
MANIMVTEGCNLRCPYCFAEEFVNHKPKEMTLEDYKVALDFALSDHNDTQVGIIGGEPLLYSHIEEALRLALSDPRTDNVMIYTNAVHLERIPEDILNTKKFRMLVNCNSPEDMGEEAFEKMVDNLFRFQREYHGDGRFRLSINIYKPDFDYSYVGWLAQEMKFDVIRLSISVPQSGALNGKTPLEYFHDMKLVSMRFVADMIKLGVMTGFDCNFLPKCVLTDAEFDSFKGPKEMFHQALDRRYSNSFWERAIVCEVHNCSPVVDILPDLQAIRCFGMSEYTKQDIRNFRSIKQLRKFYADNVDRPALAVSSSPECVKCLDRQLGTCSGGCLVFKGKELFAGK